MTNDPQRQAVLDALPNELPRLESLPSIPKEQLNEKVSKAIVDQILAGLLTPGSGFPRSESWRERWV